MTKFPSHYECLNVTRDAPPEVIRAAYRSLSQKHHPDKNVGDQAAVQMMARLNTAYSVLSDLDQRELYDLQILGEQRPAVRKKANELLRSIHRHAQGRHARIAAAVLGLLTISTMAVLWYVWRDSQSMLRLEQAAVYSTDSAAAPSADEPQAETQAANSSAKAKAAPAASAQAAAPSGIGAVASELAKPSAASKATSASAKASEYERLTAMLKSMGLGLHKLDLPTVASNTKQPPPLPAKPAEAAKPAPAPQPPVQAAKSAAAPEASRAREEVERPADPVPARSEAKTLAETSRASAPPVASASSASSALRPAVFVDARACPTPTYPITAYRNGESGSVLLALLVANDGRVLESKIQKSSGSSDLDKAARKALSQCRFKPASSDSQAEPTWATLTYVWSID